MNVKLRQIEVDEETALLLEARAEARGMTVSELLADTVAWLDAVILINEPDVEEDIRRLEEFERTGLAIPGDEVKAWIDSWGTANELPRPKPRKIE
jgi:predicted transcriptional regulator